MDELKGKPLLIFFKLREEYESRPRYVSHIDAKQDKPLELIGKYNFTKEKEVACGLCNTKHQYGVVAIFNSGDETNIGKDCGRKHFNVEWDQIEAIFKKREVEESRLALVSNFLSQKTKIQQEVEPLLKRLQIKTLEIDSIIKDLSREPMIINKFYKAIKAQGKIQVETILGEFAKEAAGGKSAFQLNTIATIEGSSAINQANNICYKINSEIIQPLHKATESSLKSLNEKELQLESKRIDRIINLAREAIEFEKSCDRFLSVTNLRKLQYLGEGEKSLHDRARKILKKYGSL